VNGWLSHSLTIPDQLLDGQSLTFRSHKRA
jgi:hypothetical protein